MVRGAAFEVWGVDIQELVHLAMREDEVWGADIQVHSLNMSSICTVHLWAPGFMHNVATGSNLPVGVQRRQPEVLMWYRVAKNCNFHRSFR